MSEKGVKDCYVLEFKREMERCGVEQEETQRGAELENVADGERN